MATRKIKLEFVRMAMKMADSKFHPIEFRDVFLAKRTFTENVVVEPKHQPKFKIRQLLPPEHENERYLFGCLFNEQLDGLPGKLTGESIEAVVGDDDEYGLGHGSFYLYDKKTSIFMIESYTGGISGASFKAFLSKNLGNAQLKANYITGLKNINRVLNPDFVKSVVLDIDYGKNEDLNELPLFMDNDFKESYNLKKATIKLFADEGGINFERLKPFIRQFIEERPKSSFEKVTLEGNFGDDLEKIDIRKDIVKDSYEKEINKTNLAIKEFSKGSMLVIYSKYADEFLRYYSLD
ncbi:hypothetical protein GC194_13190 [bacterium]|nr:hypothetical protein [bacterium]